MMAPQKNPTATPSNTPAKPAEKTTKVKPKGSWRFWKKAVNEAKDEKEEEEPVPRKPAIQAASFHPPRAISYPEWRRNPNILKPYCKPVVISAAKAMRSNMSTNFHLIHILKNAPQWNCIQLSIFNDPPSSADNYLHNLDFLFEDKEVARISADLPKIEARLLRRRRPGKDQFTDKYLFSYWDMFREDLDEVCERAAKGHFAREDDMFVLRRCARRSRRFGVKDAYQYREVRDWKPKEAKWWLYALYPKAGKAVDRMVSDAGF
jgi:hypothetical protein